MKSLGNKKEIIILILFIITLFLIRYFSTFINISYRIMDWNYGYDSKIPITIVKIDDKTLQRLQWPLNRTLYGKIFELNPKCVGIDLGFFKVNPKDLELQKKINQSKIPCVIATQLNPETNKITNTSPYLKSCLIGYTNVVLDSNNEVRKFIPTLNNNTHFALQLAKSCGFNVSKYNHSEPLLINFPYFKFKSISLIDLLNNNISEKEIKNRIVLVGVTSARLKDYFNTPILTNMPGVHVLASILSSIAENKILKENIWIDLAFILIVLIIIFLFREEKSKPLILVAITVAFLSLILTHLIYAYFNYLVHYLYILIAIFSETSYILIINYYKHNKERLILRKLFSNYVSPELMHQILKDPKNIILSGQNKYVVAMFIDIRNFTEFSENKKPDEVLNFLNKFFGIAVEYIMKNKGFVNKFLGDGLFALWNAPIKVKNCESLAVKSAIDIIEETRKKLKIELGIGIHGGIATVGNVGATKRLEYTAIGDTINTASRIESLNKFFNSEIIISKEIYDKLSKPLKQKFKKIGKIKVKGKKTFVTIYGYGKKLKIDKVKTYVFDKKL